MRSVSIHHVVSELNGSPVYVERVTSTGTAAASGTLVNGARYLVQPDGAGYLLVGAVNEVDPSGTAVPTVTTANGIYVDAGEKIYVCLTDRSVIPSHAGFTKVQWISASGTTHLNVYRMF